MRQTLSNSSVQSGFTLLELMVAVVILAILTTIAVPSFKVMIANNRASSHANALIQVLTAARTEAIRLNRSVSLCRTNVSTACAASATWDQGVLIFSDANANGALDTGDVILRADVPFVRSSQISGITGSITFDPSGLGGVSGSTTGGTFTVHPAGTSTSYDKTIVMSSTGRPRISP